MLGALAVVLVASRLGDVSGAGAAGDPVIVAAGDIACDPANKNFNGGNGLNGACMQKATYSLIANMSPSPAAVLPLGDNQYYCAGYQAFLGSYDLSWGNVLSKTYPVVGNHEYLTAPGSDGVGTGCDSTNANAAGYWKYYAGAANEGTTGQGWYSYDVGSWHLIAINSNCGNVGGCGATSAQGKWLAGDLAAHKNQCIAAYWHIPLWSSGGRAASNTQPIVDQLYAAHADVILSGHDHIYERFAQQTNTGVLDTQNGIREFIAGTGGANHTSIATIAANSQYRNATDFGLLKLTLHSGSYDWAFVNTSNTVLDQGSTACHNTSGGGGTAPPAPSLNPSETDATDVVSGSTIYYRQGASGSFSVAASSSGATSVTFPTIPGMTGGGSDSSSPFSTTYTWTSSTTASGSFGVTASSSGGTSAPTPFTVTPDATAPTTTASCSPSSCSAASGSSVAVTLTSSDAGSGLGQIYYTTDGSTPTTASNTVANGGSVSVTAGGAVKFFAVDRVGNQEAVKSQTTTVGSGGGGGSVTLQQQKVASASSAAGVTATLAATTAGDALVAAIAVAGGSTGPIASVTDSGGGTWTKGPVGFLSGSNTRIELWYRLAAPAVTSVTASFASGTTKSLSMNVSEWSGVAGVDKSANGSGTSTTATTPSLATTNASDVVIGAVNYPGTATSSLASAAFTSLTDFNVGSSTHGRAAYLTTSSTGSYQASWTLSASSAFGSAILALTAAAGPSDTTPPTTTISCNGTTCASTTYTSAVQVALSATDGTGGSGVGRTYYTTDGSTPTTTSPQYTSAFPVGTTTTIKYFSVDKVGNAESVKTQIVNVAVDTTPPATTIACNTTACASSFYSSQVGVSLSATDVGLGVDKTYYTTDGSTPTKSSAVYTTPFTISTTTTVKYFSVDLAGNSEAVKTQVVNVDTSAPTTSISCNGAACASSTYWAPVQVALSATDGTGSGTAATYYTIDGSTPTTSSPQYTAPFPATATTTIKFFSVDNVGNAESAKTQTVTVGTDNTPPTTSISCNNAACSSSAYSSAVTVRLPADDGTGSGVANTYYTTDGSDPTKNGSLYSGAFPISQTSTVKYYSVDNVGNTESVQSTDITVSLDTVAPTTTIACNGIPCGTGQYAGPVSVTLSATDTGGSGFAATYYTTDGSTPTTKSSVYSGAFDVSSTETVEYFSVDNAGNAESVQSQLIDVDTTAPVTTATCNTTPCNGTFSSNGDVTVALGSTDTDVAGTYYSLNGGAAGPYLGPFAVSQSSTVSFYSVDDAGNSETPNTLTITIDNTPPTTTISCNNAICSTSAYGSAVTVKLTATDGGSGVDKTYYTTDGSPPSTSSSVYTAPFSVTSTGTVQFFSVDKAGNSETVQSQPITITTGGGGGGTTTLAPVADTYVNSASPTTNNGTKPNIYVDADGISQSYLKFDLSGVSGTVMSVTLNIFAASSQSTGYRVFNVADTTWGETTLTWNTKPAFDAASSGSSGKVTSGTWTSVTLPQSLVQSALGGLLSLGLDTTNTQNLKLDARESGAALAPQLVITTS